MKNKILVVGDPIIDCYISTTCERLAPEAAIPVHKHEGQYLRPGGVLNVALNIASLQEETVYLATILYRDNMTLDVVATLEASGVNLDHCIFLDPHESYSTPLKTRYLASQNIVFRCDSENIPYCDPDSLTLFYRRLFDDIASYNLLVFSDYSKGIFSDPHLLSSLLSSCTSLGTPVLVDSKSNPDLFHGATLFTPNKPEAENTISMHIDSTCVATMTDAHISLMESYQTSMSLVTLGRDGASMYANGTCLFSKPKTEQVFDVTGAGDTFLAALSVKWHHASSFQSLLDYATSMASSVVTQLGTSVPTTHHQSDPQSKILTNTHHITSNRDLFGRIVIANGCFDLLHPGHINLLKYASTLGDTLIVLINSDSSIRLLKGPSRPVIPLEDRISSLTSLAFVDYILPFEEDTPYELIRQLSPHVLVKGSEYIGQSVVGSEFARETVFAPHYKNYSTSRLAAT